MILTAVGASTLHPRSAFSSGISLHPNPPRGLGVDAFGDGDDAVPGRLWMDVSFLAVRATFVVGSAFRFHAPSFLASASRWQVEGLALSWL